jgi:hypothetical protein
VPCLVDQRIKTFIDTLHENACVVDLAIILAMYLFLADFIDYFLVLLNHFDRTAKFEFQSDVESLQMIELLVLLVQLSI